MSATSSTAMPRASSRVMLRRRSVVVEQAEPAHGDHEHRAQLGVGVAGGELGGDLFGLVVLQPFAERRERGHLQLDDD